MLFESVGHETSRVLSKPIEHELQLRARMQSVEAQQGRLCGNSNTGLRQGVAFCIRFDYFNRPPRSKFLPWKPHEPSSQVAAVGTASSASLKMGRSIIKGDLHLSGEPWSAENTWLQ
jgi:hypothetical protein